jgi:hypothetical protein
VFRFPHPVEVVEEDARAMPVLWMRIAIAHTTRSGDRCLIHMTAEALRDGRTTEHEMCHCALDWDVLSEQGYRAGTTTEAVAWFEARAVRCERWLTDRRVTTEVERMSGRIPAEVLGR